MTTRSRNYIALSGHSTAERTQEASVLPGDEGFISPEEDSNGRLPSRSHSEDEWDRNITIFPALSRQFSYEQNGLKKFLKSKTGILTIFGAVVVLCGVVVFCLRNTIAIARLRQMGIPPGLYSRDGVLYVGHKSPFMIKGFSWYGMEAPTVMPAGLDKVSINEIFEFTSKFGFNAIRLPLSVENLVKNPIGYTVTFKNPELTGRSYIDVVKAITRKAAHNNVLILLDVHRLQSHEIKSKGLWYSKEVPEDRLVYVWKILCNHLKDEWNVLGADLYNEPWDAVWNSSDKSRDWKRAAERLGDSVHETCPSWTVFIEGIGGRESTTKTEVFWSENLRDIQDAPPQLKLKNKVVLSPHVYGPSVHNQSYFKDASFPKNMPSIWDDHFGESSKASGIATVVGEWGGHYHGMDREWQSEFFRYLKDRNIPFFYWCLNPDSVDTGGLIHEDWRTPEENRLSMLADAPSTKVKDYLIHFKHWRNWRV
ncbi:endoglucanase putative cellulase family GH5 [Chondrus crispus]|uniref:Endoglucanase putative cellulase family GH5 n=1 Tax=Chondrus crispus TaxID=2769 RepID=R7QH16_CHOCR|nr:endoglucanase putative cellulase family GH5 [Chondrus crispus]CDF36715.1 endoglucanase putative cellulase family GH5 [Chondrus crispus]|eukprot:XP_005716534.1 endoglucanase putative cellulase family GH5 [Chondrus crispus]